MFPDAEHPQGRYHKLRRRLKVEGVFTQKQQHIDIVAGRQLPADIDHFVHGDRQGTLIDADHA
ncbi:hypothetical protein D3C80_1914130 [compost metagenome]